MLSETTEQHMSPYLCKEHDGANPEVLSLEILQGVHEAAEEALAEIVQQASNNRELSRGNGQKILATAALLSAKRAVLLKLLWICDAMTLGHMKKLEPLAHLAIDRSGECAGLQVRRKTELFRRYSTLPTVLFDATGEISRLEQVLALSIITIHDPQWMDLVLSDTNFAMKRSHTASWTIRNGLRELGCLPSYWSWYIRP